MLRLCKHVILCRWLVLATKTRHQSPLSTVAVTDMAFDTLRWTQFRWLTATSPSVPHHTRPHHHRISLESANMERASERRPTPFCHFSITTGRPAARQSSLATALMKSHCDRPTDCQRNGRRRPREIEFVGRSARSRRTTTAWFGLQRLGTRNRYVRQS